MENNFENFIKEPNFQPIKVGNLEDFYLKNKPQYRTDKKPEDNYDEMILAPDDYLFLEKQEICRGDDVNMEDYLKDEEIGNSTNKINTEKIKNVINKNLSLMNLKGNGLEAIPSSTTDFCEISNKDSESKNTNNSSKTENDLIIKKSVYKRLVTYIKAIHNPTKEIKS